MSTTPALMTLAEVCKLPTGSWVPEGFVAFVQNIERKMMKPPKNKPFWVCIFADTTGTTTVESSLFTVPPFSQGDTIEVTGSGVKFSINQYGQKISIGDKATISIRAAQPASARHQEPAPDDRRDPQSPTPAADPVHHITGQTVGMALKEALALTIAGDPAFDANSEAFWVQVKRSASTIIRLSYQLERGKLSQKFGHQAAPVAPPPPPPPPPPAKAPDANAVPVENLDEDVPF